MNEINRFVTQDNVIYANFGAKRRVTSPEKVTYSRRGRNAVPAAERILASVTALTDQGRIMRGRAYAQQGNVIAIKPGGGRARAQVVGSQNEPFDTELILPRRSPEDMLKVVRSLAETTDGLARARRGDLDEDTLNALIAEDPTELRCRCDCPDPVTMCKHGVAVAEELARRMTSDPSLVFALRDLSFSQIEAQMTEHARMLSQEAAAGSTELFWAGRGLPKLPEPKLAPALDDADLDLLHKAMRTVSYTAIEQLRAVADIEDVYDYLTRR